MTERVFVSGEDGLLPRSIIDALRAEGAKILNDDMEKSWSIPIDVMQSVGAMTPKSAEVDVLRQDVVQEVVRLRPTMVIHSAAMVGTDKCELDEMMAWRCNAETSFNMARAAREAGARMVYFSTSAVYDPGASPPFTRETPIAPYTIYGKTKYLGEVACRQIYGPGALIVRPSFVYGGVMDASSTITRIAKAVLLDGPPVKVLLDARYRKPFMHIDDFAPVVMGLIKSGVAGTFDVAHGEPRPFGDAVEILSQLLGRKYVLEKMDWHPEGDYMRDHYARSEEAWAISGHRPAIRLEEGITRVVADLTEWRRSFER